MRLKLLSCFCILCLSIISNSGYAEVVNTKQNQFIELFVPKIEAANQIVLEQRAKLKKIDDVYQKNQQITNERRLWLQQLAGQYDIKFDNMTLENLLASLLKRVDILPTSLVLAQAINESAWGQSRFATEGKNYFGQWCYQAGCGLVPKDRNANAKHEVKSFPSANDSINSYFHNINTNQAYLSLRTLRQQLRDKGSVLDSLYMAKGLTAYSQQGETYVKRIQSLIKGYALQRFDQKT